MSSTPHAPPSNPLPQDSQAQNQISHTPNPDHEGRQSPSTAAAAAELTSTRLKLRKSLREFADFPIPGIAFVDILPVFQDPDIHEAFIRALELQLHLMLPNSAKPDVIVGLDARGFLFGPSLALRLRTSFVPVRKKGKMPGPCTTVSYEKEYGKDEFQMQEVAVKPGQKVLIVDDIIATGGSAAAAGQLVRQLGGEVMAYLFLLEVPGLNGREKLGDCPIATLIEY